MESPSSFWALLGHANKMHDSARIVIYEPSSHEHNADEFNPCLLDLLIPLFGRIFAWSAELIPWPSLSYLFESPLRIE